MSVTQDQVLQALRRIRGPDLKGNIVELGLVSEVIVRDGRVSFSISVPPDRAAELEPLRQAAEKVVSELPEVTAAMVVLTAERGPGATAGPPPRRESARVAAARSAAVGGPPQAQQHAHAPARAGAPATPGRASRHRAPGRPAPWPA